MYRTLLLAILWNSAFRCLYLPFSPLPFAYLLFSAVCKASSGNCFAFLHFFFLGMVLITTSCTMSQTSVHSSSGTLSDLIPWIYFSPTLCNCKGFDLGHIWMVWWFFPLLLSLDFAIKNWWSEPQSTPGLVFAYCIDLLHLWLQRI